MVVSGARVITFSCARGLALRWIARGWLLTGLLTRRRLLPGLLTRRRLLTRLLARWWLLTRLLARGRLLAGLLTRWWLPLLLPRGRLTLRRLLAGRLLTLLGRLVLWWLLTGRGLALAAALALTFVLVLILVVLVLVLIRRLLLLELRDFSLHEIAVVLAVGVVGSELQRGLVGFDGVSPRFDRILGRGLFGLLAGAVEGVT